MLLILLYLLIVFIFLYFFVPNKPEPKGKGKSGKEKFISEQFNSKKHYGSGLMIAEPAYKADTNIEDRLVFDIGKKMEKAKANNIHELYNILVDDNYKLFNNLKKTVPKESSSRPLYVNLHYDPKTERKYNFSTELPKLGFYKQFEKKSTPRKDNKLVKKAIVKELSKK